VNGNGGPYCLSVHEPWASAIVEGAKRIENRTWRTEYRGRLLIHAAKHQPELFDMQRAAEWGWMQTRPYVLGAIIGAVELIDVLPLRELTGQPFAEGPWCWVLRAAQRFARPRTCRGQPGLFVER